MNILSQNLHFSKFFFNLGCKFSKPQTNHLLSFADGLLNCDKRRNLSNILEHSFSSRDRSSFTKFLLYSPWKKEELRIKRKSFALKELEKVASKNPIFYSIDDTLVVKHVKSKNIEGLMFNHSHVSNKREWSHCLVSLHGSSNGLSLPLDFKTYLNKESCAQQNRVFKGKGELAIDMLEGIQSQLHRKCYILADSWYTSADFINKSQKLGFQVIGALKSNRIFYPKGIRNKLNEFSKELKEKDLSLVTANGRKHYVYRYEGHIKDIENAVILISWIDEFDSTKKPFYIITTDTSLSAKQVLEHYKNRWEIETSFRYQKDRLGLDQCEMRKLNGIEKFWELLYLVYNYIELRRFKEIVLMNLGELIEKCKAMRKKDIISFIYNGAMSGISKEELLNVLKVPL